MGKLSFMGMIQGEEKKAALANAELFVLPTHSENFGIAVAEARNGSCTACFMSLRPQVMAEIRRGDDVIICDNCNRILYYVPSEARKEAPATAAPNAVA